jgi:c(7)-type cytochrome triheme protein
MRRIIAATLILSATAILVPTLSSAVPEGIVLTWPDGSTGTVYFDGTVHAKKGLQCDACHVAGLFQTKKNADKMTMAEMNRGRFCGFCHNGKKAFSTSDPKSCKKCHQGKKEQ